jgi:sugar phosphate isomerase/epimerase
MNRREFLLRASVATAAVLTTVSCRSLGGNSDAQRIAFNTANLVGRVSGYRYELKNWGQQHDKTVAATDERAWASICHDISKAGYRAVEVWEAHAAPEGLTPEKGKLWRRILDDHGLTPVAYAGGLRKETVDICHTLGIPHLDGGLRGLSPEKATELCRQTDMKFNLENHPEKNVAEILKPIGGGNEWLGVCVDTGWLGTQGASSADIIRELGTLVRHVHVKDVQRAGSHETCRLGDGTVNIPAALNALTAINYRGWYSWEDEPEDRNPLDLAAWTLSYLRQRLA